MTRADAKWRTDSRFGSTVALTSPLPVASRLPTEIAGPRDPAQAFGQWVVDATDTVSVWYERARGRRQLMRLDDRLLRDLGISRAQARDEAAKPFWRA